MFENNTVFRVDVWDKTILTVAPFLELLISFLPVSRDSLPGTLRACQFLVLMQFLIGRIMVFCSHF